MNIEIDWVTKHLEPKIHYTIEISPEELARQLSEDEAHKLYDCIVNVIGKYENSHPESQYCKCPNPQEDFSNGVHPNYCKHCHKLLPEKDKEIEELPVDNTSVRKLIDKLNELIQIVNQRK